MKLTYDPQADAMYFSIVDSMTHGEAVVTHTCTCNPHHNGSWMNIDYDKDGHMLGIELLFLKNVETTETLRQIEEQADLSGSELQGGLEA